MSVVSLVKALPETKQQIDTFSNMVINSIVKGDVNVLDVDFQLKCFEMAIDKIRKHFEIKDLLIEEVEKYKNQDYKEGSKVSVQTKTNYEYNHNPEWVKLDEAKKKLEVLMKSLPEDMANAETGEITPKAKIKSISKYVKYDFKK